MNHLLRQFQGQIRDLCAKYHVCRLEVFGSAARGTDSSPKSDIDFLVEFEPIPAVVYKDSYFGLLHGLEDLLGRRIDLIDTATVDNACFLRAIEPDRQVVYAGWSPGVVAGRSQGDRSSA
ncbi:MAG: nucleotidyltransferase domain-containing protein [Planctomycetes bacterium]|nr:nucleotidyltransferase domain-containing protein [Planctomycetota bacterium]